MRRGPVGLAFVLVVVAGALGGGIGFGLVRASCDERPAKLRLLLKAAIDTYAVPDASCQTQRAIATIIGALIAAAGAGIVAMLVLRAMADWRVTPARARRDEDANP